MTATTSLARFARIITWRLLLVVFLAVAVSAATYGVAVSPYGTALSSTARRPPGRPADPAAQAAAPATTDAANAPVAGATTGGATTQAQPTQPVRPAGGPPGRGPNLTQGLPELGAHAAVVAVIVLILNGARSLWTWFQRRRGGNRAPVFHHVSTR